MPDEAIMPDKHFKILNSKMNSILQISSDIIGKTSVSCVEVEYLLKVQETRTLTLIEDMDKLINECLANHFQPFDFKILKLLDVKKEHHELFEKMVFDSKSSVELKIKELTHLFTKEVKNLDNFCVSLETIVDVLANATTHLVEDITTFNKDYSSDSKLKTEPDKEVFEKVNTSLSEL